MHHFDYRNGILHAEGVDLVALADEVGTPFYCYSTATLERHYQVFADAFADVPSLVCYAMKANSNQAVIATLARLGAGADVVSGGELKRALAAGIPAQKIMFSGVGKTARELAAAVDAGIFCINVEFGAGTRIALIGCDSARPHRACVAARQSRHRRQDPSQDRDRKIRKQVRHSDQPRARGLCPCGEAAGIHVAGVDMHIGSQIIELAPFEEAFALLSEFVQTLRGDGHEISHVDLGGGLGIPYRHDEDAPPLPDAYAEVVKRATKGLGCKLIFEPGRLIVGNAGILVTRVLYLKRGEAKSFVIVDAAMNDLVRPTLYEAHHDILPVRKPPARRRSSPTWSARSARPATTSRSTATCRSRSRAI